MPSFSSQHRLIYRKNFQSIFRSSAKVASRSFVVLYRQNELPFSRLGMQIRKSILNRAVDRNRIKRLIRESFRQSEIKTMKLDMIILLKTNGQFHDKEQLRQELNELWRRLGTCT